MEVYEPENLGTYVSSAQMIKEGDETYDTQSVSNRYSTGVSILDDYLSGGYGKHNSYEFVIISSAPNSYKTTFALRMTVPQVENQTPMMWILPEMSYGEITNMYRAFYYPDKDLADQYFTSAIDSGALKIVDQDTIDDISTPKELQTIIEMGVKAGVEIFYIDPLNYILGQSTGGISEQTKAEKDFARWLSRTLTKHKLTAIAVMHNVKDPNLHRQFGMSGSAAFSQQATKIIEVRAEDKLPAQGMGIAKIVPGQLITAELWKSRGTERHMFEPLVLEASFNPEKHGVKIIEPSVNDLRQVSSLLDKQAPDVKQRKVWDHQRELLSLALGRDI